MSKMRKLQKEAHEISVDHGFWGNDANTNIPTKLALIHSEISEALEAFRNEEMETFYVDVGRDLQKPEGFGVELADAVIRLFDLAEHLDYDLQTLVIEKMAFNKGRPQMHGKTI